MIQELLGGGGGGGGSGHHNLHHHHQHNHHHHLLGTPTHGDNQNRKISSIINGGGLLEATTTTATTTLLHNNSSTVPITTPTTTTTTPPTTTTSSGAAATATPESLRCPRCDSANTKFCYYNNYNLTQPRHFCKTCRRYWTKGGALRNVPIGGGCRKNKTTIVSSSVVSGKSAASGGGGVANSTGKMKMVMSSSEINNIGRSGFGGGGLFDLHDHHQLSSNSPILWGSPQNSHLLALLRSTTTPPQNPNPNPSSPQNNNNSSESVVVKQQGGLDPVSQAPSLGLCSLQSSPMASESSQGNFNNGPSSPDDSFTSQIGNTNSSPGDASRRRRRGRSTTPAASATPTAPPSRFAASSEATPTPSAGTRRNGSNGKRRAPSAAATPTSTDDLPPSSEGGDGFDMDEDRPTFVWGTNISVNDVKAAIVRFLKNFRDQQSQTPDSEFHTEGKYIETIKRVLEIEGDSLDVNAHDVFDYDSDLYAKMVRYPLEVLAIFDIVLMEMVPLIEPLFEKHIQTRIYNLKTSTSMRNLNPCDIERMVSLKGMVIRCSSIIPEIREAIFRCLVCGYYSEPVAVEKGRITEPTRCLKEECQARNSMTLVHNRCRFTDKQIVRLQETPDEILEGGTPHTVSLLMHDKLVDAGKPGDRVEVTGIYRAMTVRIGPAHRTVKSLFKTYIDCLHIKKTDKSRMLVDDQMEIDNPLGGNSDDIVFDEKKVEELKELSKQPDIYDRLMRSLAPNIWELDDVKRGLLCQLFGGIALKLPSGANFRGDINILLVGDPGTSKSQLLQYIHKLSPRGIYTSGRGSSAVGLTAYVTKDPETGETVLESGALVLSDRGICCIDEFDKMSDNARSMLHEVMEQQTVSIAKAGIIASLNARASVLACANPSGSRYNPRLSVIDNIHLPPTLLSRFDLIYLILDKADEHTDRRLAKHIVALHFENPESIEQDVLDLPTLIAYVSYARKHIHPQLSDEAAEDLTRGYVDLRRRGNFPGSGKKVITATPRQIESLIRLSEALARIRFSEVVEKRDVTEAFRLLEVAMQQSATDHSTGTIDMDLITTGVSASERMRRENLLSATRNLIMEKMQLGGPSMRLLEILEELKKQSSGTEFHLNDLRNAVSTLSSEGFVSVHGDSVKRV